MEKSIPALRQSIVEQMACEHGYKLVYIDGLKSPSTEASYRGTDVHSVLSEYVTHCAKQHVPADFMYLDSLIGSSTDEVTEILTTCRDNITVDWQNFFASEISMGLDRDFKPTHSYGHDGERIPMSPVWGDRQQLGKDAAYCGILDTIYLMPGGKVARIVDFKTHPRPFPADSFQGKLYSLFLLMHLPELQEVEFSLHFVRYAHQITSQKYYRSDVPQMMDDVRRVRARQIELHEKVDNQQPLRAHGGAHCTYCPCTLDPLHIQCPIMRLNPMMNLSPAERLNWRLVHDVMSRANNQVMQKMVEGTGEAIHSQDANGKNYTFGPVEKQKITYPLFAPNGEGGFTLPIVDALLDWCETFPEDLQPKRRDQKPWFLNLRIGSTQLKSYLKAKKREIIDNRIKDLADVETKIELRIERDAEIDDGAGEEHKDWDADGTEDLQF